MNLSDMDPLKYLAENGHKHIRTAGAALTAYMVGGGEYELAAGTAAGTMTATIGYKAVAEYLSRDSASDSNSAVNRLESEHSIDVDRFLEK